MAESDALAQRRRTVRVLELLEESFNAWRRGDMPESDRLGGEAAQLDVDAVSVIQGGMIIGEIPNPERDPDVWAQYVQAARDALADAEDAAYVEAHGNDNLDTGHTRDPEGDEAAHA